MHVHVESVTTHFILTFHVCGVSSISPKKFIAGSTPPHIVCGRSPTNSGIFKKNYWGGGEGGGGIRISGLEVF